MLIMDVRIKLGDEIANVLKNLKGVKAIAFYGAIASGFADKYSDIDLMCLCDKAPSPNERKLFWEDFVDYIGAKGIVDVFRYKNENFGVEFREIHRLNETIASIGKKGFIAKDDDSVVGWISGAKIVWDPKQVYANLKQKLKKYEKKPKWLIKILWNLLIDFDKENWPEGSGIRQAILRKNYIWIGRLMQVYLDRFLVCLYDLNGKFYTDFKQKWAYKEINTFKYKPKNCVKKLEQIYLLGNDLGSARKKIKLFSELIKDTTPLIKRKYKLNF